jgi:hypothetical protein
MEGNVDKCLAFCQALVASNHQFTFALNIGKDTFSFSTYDLARDLKKAAPKPKNRRDRRAVDPAVKQKAAIYAAAASAEQAAAGAPVQSPAARPEMGGAAGPAHTPVEEAKREPCCRRCEQPVAGHPGGTRGCGANCTNIVLTPEKLRQASDQGDLSLATPGKGGREEQCENCNSMMTPEHQCEAAQETAEDADRCEDCGMDGETVRRGLLQCALGHLKCPRFECRRKRAEEKLQRKKNAEVLLNMCS